MFRISIYLETSSWYLGKRERWGGYVMAYEKKDGELYTVEGFEKVSGTYNYVLIHMLNAALKRVKKQSEIHICSANSFILDMIDKNLPKWAKNGWKNSKGQEIKDLEEWKMLYEQGREHLFVTHRGLHEFSHWMKGKFSEMNVDNSGEPHKETIDGDLKKVDHKNFTEIDVDNSREPHKETIDDDLKEVDQKNFTKNGKNEGQNAKNPHSSNTGAGFGKDWETEGKFLTQNAERAHKY